MARLETGWRFRLAGSSPAPGIIHDVSHTGPGSSAAREIG